MSGQLSIPVDGIGFFFRSAIATLDLDTIVLTWGHFFCSTAPQVFFRPDRRMPRPARADDVKAGRAAATEGSAFTSASTTAGWMRRVE
jgi:hypothetical protein